MSQWMAESSRLQQGSGGGWLPGQCGPVGGQAGRGSRQADEAIKSIKAGGGKLGLSLALETVYPPARSEVGPRAKHKCPHQRTQGADIYAGFEVADCANGEGQYGNPVEQAWWHMLAPVGAPVYSFRLRRRRRARQRRQGGLLSRRGPWGRTAGTGDAPHVLLTPNVLLAMPCSLLMPKGSALRSCRAFCGSGSSRRLATAPHYHL